MLKFTLMKNLYYEMDPDKMDNVKEIVNGDARYRILSLNFPEIPEVYSMTMQERYLPYATMYYLYVNSDRYPSELTDERVKKLLMAFYRHFHPEYVVDGVLRALEESGGFPPMDVRGEPDDSGSQKQAGTGDRKEVSKAGQAGHPDPESIETFWKALDLLSCLDPDKMPGYQKKYAYKEILTVEDLRNGKTGDEHKGKASFPGMVFTDKYRPE